MRSVGWLKTALPALLLTVAIHPALLESIKAGYPDDTFFNLSLIERVGLVVITTVAAAGLLYVSIRKSQFLYHFLCVRMLMRRPQQPGHSPYQVIACVLSLLFDVSLTALIFLIGVTLSPQLFYSYYITIIPELPAQWVIRSGAVWSEWRHIISLEAGDSMADQATALLFWTMMFACVISAALTLRRFNSSCSTDRSS